MMYNWIEQIAPYVDWNKCQAYCANQCISTHSEYEQTLGEHMGHILSHDMLFSTSIKCLLDRCRVFVFNYMLTKLKPDIASKFIQEILSRYNKYKLYCHLIQK